MSSKMKTLTGGLFQVGIDYSDAARIDRRVGKLISVHPATLKDDCGEQNVVVKVTRGCDQKDIDRLVDCAKIHRSLQDHDGVIQFYGCRTCHVKEDDSFTFKLLMERADGSLDDVLEPKTRDGQNFSKEVLKKLTEKELVQQLVRPVAYIHSKTNEANDRVAHRDLKPGNFLLKRLKRGDRFAVKLADFDSTKRMDTDETIYNISTGKIFTDLYKAPEIDELKRNNSTVKIGDFASADVYALGIVIFKALDRERRHLFQGNKLCETVCNMNNNERNQLMVADIDELGRNLVSSMTQFEPKKRIDIWEAEKHPFFWEAETVIGAINAFNLHIVALGRGDEAQRILNKLNESFFMVFEEKWKNFTLEEVYKKSKYPPTLVGYIRYCRNLLIHWDEHSKHFKSESTSKADALQQILKNTPSLILHILWFAKRNFPELEFAQDFSEKCVEAYEERKELKRKSIENFEKMHGEVHLQFEGGSAVEMSADDFGKFFDQFKKDIDKPLKLLEFNLQPLKDTADKYRKELRNKEREMQKLKASHNYSKGKIKKCSLGLEDVGIEDAESSVKIERLKEEMLPLLKAVSLLDLLDHLENPERFSKRRIDKEFQAVEKKGLEKGKTSKKELETVVARSEMKDDREIRESRGKLENSPSSMKRSERKISLEIIRLEEEEESLKEISPSVFL